MWQPIETYKENLGEQVICSHIGNRWIRFGFKYPGLNRWYYSTTTEKSMFGDDEAPTHWMPMIKGPWK